jgi:ribonucleoside-diphosphate reductase alpha chain
VEDTKKLPDFLLKEGYEKKCIGQLKKNKLIFATADINSLFKPMPSISKIKKRNGQIVPFDQKKIAQAIWKAAESVGGKDYNLANKIAAQVTTVLEIFYKNDKDVPQVEQIQDLVEKILIENGHAKTAKAYILYRQKQKDQRIKKASILGPKKETKFSYNVLKVLEKSFLKKDEEGNSIETPEQMFRRVAKYIAAIDEKYKDHDKNESEEIFYNMMYNMEFLPNTPTLANAGTKNPQLAACFVLPISHNIEEIFETLKKASIIQSTGGGTGYNFSNIPPKTDIITSGQQISSGPVAFMKVFDTATNAIQQPGKRKGANMAILNVNHPDILDFINSKEKEDKLTNFNISVGITEEFMQAVENDSMYNLIHPQTKKIVNSLHAKSVLDLIAQKAWSNGEPGIIFLDQIEKSNPLPGIKLSATNPCGEQPLADYEACNLASINISKYVTNKKIDWNRLSNTIRHAVHFLDNVIDASNYQIEQITETVLGNRKIGLGIMGFADLLFALEIPYNSHDAEELAEKIMLFIKSKAYEASEKLAETRGAFPNFKKSTHKNPLRNATLTTIAPTGTLSIIAECSSGIEPLFALAYQKNFIDGGESVHVNKTFLKKIEELNIHSEDFIYNIMREGTLKKLQGIPDALKQVFVVSHDIHPTWHVRMQAAFQKHTDNAVSKTVNLPAQATAEEIKNIFILAYKTGCKGITVYRDRSRKKQVLTQIGKNEMQNMIPEDKFIDNQTSLPFNNESYDQDFKNVQEVIPPPIIQTL